MGENVPNPPKIQLPGRPGWQMLCIGIGLALAAAVYQLVISHTDDPPIEDKNANIKASEFEKIIAPGGVKVEAPDQKGGVFLIIKHGDVLLDSGFDRSWSVAEAGRQILLRDNGDTTICQSLLIPRAEYDGMVKQFGGVQPALEAQQKAGFAASAPAGATVTISGEKLFDGPTPEAGVGVKLTGVMSLNNRTARNYTFVVWIANARNAAGLTCARVDAQDPDQDLFLGLLKRYKFKKAGN